MTLKLPFLDIQTLLARRRLSPPAQSKSRLQAWLLAAWLAAMIALPITKFIWGQAAVAWNLSAAVVVQVGLVLVILQRAWGWRRTGQAAITVAALGWLAEATGTATGLPFGVYEYTGRLQPQVAHVPLLIPLAWLMMLPPAWAVAYGLAGRWGGLKFIAWSGLALTAWDLFLDPQMVAWGFWEWAEPGGYFGIPWLNFGGWWLTAALITALIRPRNLPTRPLVLIYSLTWLLETGGLFFFWGLSGPAIAGFLGMGGLLWLAWFRGHGRA